MVTKQVLTFSNKHFICNGVIIRRFTINKVSTTSSFITYTLFIAINVLSLLSYWQENLVHSYDRYLRLRETEDWNNSSLVGNN